MSPSDPKSRQPEPSPSYSFVAGFLSYLIPGLGQIWLGKTSKGFMLMACLLLMFFTGQAMGDWRNVYLPDLARDGNDPIPWERNPWRIPRPFLPVANIVQHRWHFAGQFWIGIAAWPALWQYNHMPVPDQDANPFWHNFQRAPESEPALNDYLAARDKTPDLAWVYTVIAGMLNILVIYDAFAGPAYGVGLPKDKKPAAPEAGT